MICFWCFFNARPKPFNPAAHDRRTPSRFRPQYQPRPDPSEKFSGVSTRLREEYNACNKSQRSFERRCFGASRLSCHWTAASQIKSRPPVPDYLVDSTQVDPLVNESVKRAPLITVLNSSCSWLSICANGPQPDCTERLPAGS